MLKHVQISPLRNRSDSLSLRSSTSCASSICGSPEPPNELQRSPSRASSYSSLNETLPQTTIKVFTNCLRIDIEYKTLGIQWDTTSKEVISQLLRRLKMRHRDPRLFYLSMEVTVRRAGIKTVLVLDDEARPAILQACHPKGDSRFCLQLKPGGLIRVHTSALQSSSQYKSLVISQETTSDELLCILLSCYNSMEPVEQFSLYEVCPGQEYQRKLHPDDIPLKAQNERIQRGETCHFLVRRNPNYPRRRQIISSSSVGSAKFNITEVPGNCNRNLSDIKIYNLNKNDNSSSNISNKINSICKKRATNISLEDFTVQKEKEDCQIYIEKKESGDYSPFESNLSFNHVTKDKKKEIIPHYFKKNAITISTSTLQSLPSTPILSPQNEINNLLNPKSTENVHSAAKGILKEEEKELQNTFKICQKCQNSFKSCEFCNKNSTAMILNSLPESSILSSSSTTNSLAFLQHSKNNKKQEQLNNVQVNSYSPVYNIREIRTVSHSFSTFGNDKKLLDIDFGTHLIPLTSTLKQTSPEEAASHIKTTELKIPITSTDTKNNNNKKIINSIASNKNCSILTLIPFTNKSQNFNKFNSSLLLKSNNCNNGSKEFECAISDLNCNVVSSEQLISVHSVHANSETTLSSNLLAIPRSGQKGKHSVSKSTEEVNNNPAKGLGNFVYI